MIDDPSQVPEEYQPIATKLLSLNVGMTHQQVHEILGEPDKGNNGFEERWKIFEHDPLGGI